MAGRLGGRVAIVNAAGQGIGRAVAERFIAEGAQVHASDIDGTLLEDLKATSTAVLDSTDAQAVAAYFEALEQVDVVVHAVGYVHQGTIEECPPEAWRRSMTITLDSAYTVIGQAIPRMKNRGGSIITIASIASSLKGLPKRAAYSAAKGGVIGLTKSVAADYLSYGIRANAVCPGTVDSPSLRGRIDELAEQMGSRAEAERFFIERQPAGRFGRPDEIASLCAYLAADEGSLMTGQAIQIDGGITI